MKNIILLIASVFIFQACSYEIINLTTAKNEVQKYYESGEYDREMDKIIADAIEKLEKTELNSLCGAVFDIDETALSNYPHIKEVDYGGVSSLWEAWTFSSKAPAIPQVKKLYDFLVSKGVKIFFITGRNNKYYEATKKNLIDQGYTKFDTLICRSEKERGIGAVQYKAPHRAEIAKKRIKIIANIGDQWSDLDGGNSGLAIKIPDYLYLVD